MEQAVEKKGVAIRVVLACFIVGVVSYGTCTVYSLFLPHYVEEFNTTLGTVSLMHTVTCAVGAVLNIFVAKLFIKKFGIRMGGFVAAILGTIACLIYYFSNGVPMLMVGAFVHGANHSFGSMVFATACSSNWFYTGRKLTTTLMMTITSAAAMIFMMITGYLLQGMSWRSAQLVLAAIQFVVVGGASFLIIDSPEKVGLKMVGYEKFKKDQEALKTGTVVIKEEPSITDTEARRTSFYWLLLVATLFGAFTGAAVGIFGPVYWQGTGMDALTSAQFASLFGTIRLIGTIVMGVLLEKFGVVKPTLVTMLLGMIGVIGMVLVGGQSGLVSVFICLASLLGVTSNAYAVNMVAYSFGPKHMGKISGVFIGMFAVSGIFNPMIFGFMVDATGGYTVSWIFEIALGVIALALMALLAKNVKKMREKTAQIYIKDQQASEASEASVNA